MSIVVTMTIQEKPFWPVSTIAALGCAANSLEVNVREPPRSMIWYRCVPFARGNWGQIANPIPHSCVSRLPRDAMCRRRDSYRTQSTCQHDESLSPLWHAIVLRSDNGAINGVL